MGRERRNFPAEFKKNAVELVRTSGRSVAAIATELGIERGLLDRWRRETNEAETGSRKAFVGQGNPRDEELAQLRREVADLRETNEILKKQWASSPQRVPGDGVSIHGKAPWTALPQEDVPSIRGLSQWLSCLATTEAQSSSTGGSGSG